MEEKFSKFIKEIRQKNNLTQKDLAEKYHVTYQAVSKWEKAKNLPDISLIKQIAKDYNMSVEEILDGKKNKKKYVYILPLIIILIVLLFFIFKDNDFSFKTIKSNCDNFNITGSLAYNSSKTSIYISNIDYCGKKDDTTYEEIECILYEKNNEKVKEINSCELKNNIKLEEYLNSLKINVDNYNKVCKEFSKNSLLLEINGKTKDGKIVTYEIPLSIENNCSK